MLFACLSAALLATDGRVAHERHIKMRLGQLKISIPEPLMIDLSGTGNPKWMHGLVGAELFEK